MILLKTIFWFLSVNFLIIFKIKLYFIRALEMYQEIEKVGIKLVIFRDLQIFC